MELKREVQNENNLAQLLYKKEDKFSKLISALVLLSLIAGIETTLLLYSAEQKGMDVLNGVLMSEMGVMGFIMMTIAMGSLGLFFTFMVQTLIVILLALVLKEKPVNIKGIMKSVVNAGILIVIGSGVNAIIALLVSAKETTFTSLALLVHDHNSALHTFMAEFELFYIASLIVFSLSLEKVAKLKRKNAVIITLIIALISLVFHMLTVTSGTYLK
ncbi:hypothetical protein [Halalkalibacter flavus]|uniref:hypothetical protein n=1 Tax=Halalkalibacter flavus TaxID=3090668 RepID=UPI002FCA5594